MWRDWKPLQCLSVTSVLASCNPWQAMDMALGWVSSLPLSMWSESNWFSDCSAELEGPRQNWDGTEAGAI